MQRLERSMGLSRKVSMGWYRIVAADFFLHTMQHWWNVSVANCFVWLIRICNVYAAPQLWTTIGHNFLLASSSAGLVSLCWVCKKVPSSSTGHEELRQLKTMKSCQTDQQLSLTHSLYVAAAAAVPLFESWAGAIHPTASCCWLLQ